MHQVVLIYKILYPLYYFKRTIDDVKAGVDILVFRYQQNHLQVQHPVSSVVILLVLRKNPSLLIQYHFLVPGCLLAFFSNISDSLLSSRDTSVAFSFHLLSLLLHIPIHFTLFYIPDYR